MLELIDHRGRRRAVTPESLHRRTPGRRNSGLNGARVLTILLFGGAFMALLHTSARLLFAPPGWTSWLIGAASFGLAWWADAWLTKQAWWYGRAVLIGHTRLALRRGACPVCWYDLRGLEPEPDACRTCPECGSAWRLGRGRAASAAGPG